MSTNTEQRKLAAIMFTDKVGHSQSTLAPIARWRRDS